MSGASALVEQALAIEHPTPVPGVSGVWGLEVDGQSVQVTQAQLTAVRAGFVKAMQRGLTRATIVIEGGSYGHRDLIATHEDQFIVSRISDTLGRVDLPDLDIWDPAYQALWRAKAEIKAAQLTDAAHDTEAAQASAQRAMEQFVAYREGTITGAGRAETTLEWTRDISFAVAGIMATVATGGTAGLLIGTGISASGTAAQQAMEVHLDMRREVDWRGIGVDAAIGIVVGALGGRIAGAKSLEWFFKSPVGASLGRVVVQRIATNLLLGRFQAMLTTSIRAAVDNLAGEKGAMTGEQLVTTLAHQFTDPKGLFMDALNGELSQQIAAAAKGKPAPPVLDAPPPTLELSAPPVAETVPPAVESAPPVAEATPPAVDTAPLELDAARDWQRPDPEAGALDLAGAPDAAPLGPAPETGALDLPHDPAAAPLELDPTRHGPKTPVRNAFGDASAEPGGSEHRQGMAFNEWNAGEIERGLRVDYDPIAGRPRKVSYRVDPDIAGSPGSDPRSFRQDASTTGAQSRDASYTGTGWERGHLAQLEAFKNGSPDAQQAANLLTNIVPMAPGLNRGAPDATGTWQNSAWRQAEARTVDTHAQGRSVIVEVIPIYDAVPQRLADGTPIPTAVQRRVLTLDGTVIEDAVHPNR